MSTLNNTKTDQNISWRCKHTWRTASYNTLWCLLGCSIGDFGTIYFFQVTEHLNPIDHKWIILSLAIMNGLITSIILETYILSRQMILKEAFRVAIGMSLISMISMEVAMNIVDVIDWIKTIQKVLYCVIAQIELNLLYKSKNIKFVSYSWKKKMIFWKVETK